MAYQDKIWAKRAANLRLSEVERVRTVAEKWRNGLLGLTALLTVVAVLKGPEKIADLSSTGRNLVGVLSAVALIALLAGSASAMRASFGVPTRDQLTSSATLKQWSSTETRRATQFLRVATWSFFIAIPLVFAATAVTWFDGAWFAKAGVPKAWVIVERNDGTAPVRSCGELVALTKDTVELKRPANDPVKVNVSIPMSAVGILTVVASCPSP